MWSLINSQMIEPSFPEEKFCSYIRGQKCISLLSQAFRRWSRDTTVPLALDVCISPTFETILLWVHLNRKSDSPAEQRSLWRSDESFRSLTAVSHQSLVIENKVLISVSLSEVVYCSRRLWSALKTCSEISSMLGRYGRSDRISPVFSFSLTSTCTDWKMTDTKSESWDADATAREALSLSCCNTVI